MFVCVRVCVCVFVFSVFFFFFFFVFSFLADSSFLPMIVGDYDEKKTQFPSGGQNSLPFRKSLYPSLLREHFTANAKKSQNENMKIY